MKARAIVTEDVVTNGGLAAITQRQYHADVTVAHFAQASPETFVEVTIYEPQTSYRIRATFAWPDLALLLGGGR